MPRRVFPLRSLSAALVLSTSFTVPAYAVYVNVTEEGDLTGPIPYTGPIHIFYSSARLTSASYGFWFNNDLDEGYLLDGSSIKTHTIGGAAFLVSGDVGTLSNAGTIESTFGDGFELVDDVGSFINTRTGIIWGGSEGVYIDGVTTSFTNHGSITGSVAGVSFDADVGTFENTGTISATTGAGIYFDNNVDTFTNSGTISSTGTGIYAYDNVNTYDNVGTFTNSGTIQSDGRAVRLVNVTTFTNSGAIRGGATFDFNDQFGSAIGAADIGTFTNSGTISSAGRTIHTGHIDSFTNTVTGSITTDSITGAEWAVFTAGVDSFVNDGTISGAEGGVHLDGSPSVTNTGTITGTESHSIALEIGMSGADDVIFNSGRLIGGQFGLRATDGRLGRITNAGTIQGTLVSGAGIDYQGGTIDNSGTIKGHWGIIINPSNATLNRAAVINSGTIEGTSGIAISFDYDDTGYSGDDSLTLLTGSRILGLVEFADGDDTLDVSGFRGNTVLTVDNLETVVAGNTLVASSLDGSGSGTVSIVDATGITSSGSASLGEVAGAIGGEIAGALGGITGGAGPVEPMGYAPSRPVGAAEAAADELVATADPTGPEVWGKVFGGIANKTNDYNAVLGGIIAGSHVAVDANTRLGGVVSVSGSRFATVGGGQTVTGTIGAAGLYGSTDLGGLVVSYSVLGGVAANHSDRTVTAAVTETARADFGSWFWSPELGLSMPVPLFEGVETDAGFKLRYVGGGVGSYTETGSSQNLSVGTAAVNLLDARVELTSKTQVASNDYGDVMLYGTAGLLAQQNFGGSVAIAGFPIAQTPASFAYGAYADITLEGPIGPTAKASASTGLELRSDGLSSASANLGLSSTF